MAALKVDRDQFVEAVRILSGVVKRKRQAKAILTFDGGLLSIRIANTVVDARAEGEWAGSAKIGAQVLLSATSPPPIADPITLAVEGHRLHIERLSTLCEWTETKRRATSQ